jgi:competence protein ComEC
VTLYTLIGLTWLTTWWRQRWWVALFLGVVLTLVPLWQRQATATEATILATSQEPVMVIRDRGKTLLLNSGDAAIARYTLLPLLQKAGVNQIDWGVATTQNNAGWNTLQQFLPIRAAYTSNRDSSAFTQLQIKQPVQLGEIVFTVLQQYPLVASFQIQDQTWLWLGSLKPKQQQRLLQAEASFKADVLWWSGRSLEPALSKKIQPKLAIASGRKLDFETDSLLKKIGAQTYWTKRDGGIRWSPQRGIQTTLIEDAQTSAL